MEAQLAGINTVYYSPSGILNQVALAAIPFNASSKTISSKYKLVQMGSTKNIVVQEPEIPVTNITLMGGISYNADSVRFATNTSDSSFANANIYTTTIMRGTDKATKSFDYLPATLTEVNSITATATNAAIATNVYTEQNATEEAFKKMDGHSPSVLHIATHGAIGVAAYTSSTLGEAISTIARYYSIRGQFIDIQLDSTANDIIIKLLLRTECNDVGMFLLEAFLASAQTGIEFITGHPLQEGRLILNYPPPPHAKLYHNCFHQPIQFDGDETALILPITLLNTPSLYADPVAKLHAEQQCEQQFNALQQNPGPLSLRITALLRHHPGRLWTMQEVADVLHLSTRTLMRHLKEEGASYQELQDAELSRQAGIHLQDRRHTTESLATALGYSDTSGFRRAFYRWFGMSLKDYLAAHPAPAPQ